MGRVVFLLSIGVIFKKNWRFPSTHVGGNRSTQQRGISCHTSQLKDAQRHKTLAERLAANEGKATSMAPTIHPAYPLQIIIYL